MKSICIFPGCDRDLHSRGLCSAHRKQRDKGMQLRPLWFKRPALPNPEIPGTCLIQLTQGLYAIVDALEAGAVAQFNWHAFVTRTGVTYAVTQDVRVGRGTRLHRFLWKRWGMPETPEIDHKNTNGLDCRRENLRAATTSQNHFNVGKRSHNTSGYKGVSYDRDRELWAAAIKVNGKTLHLGRFPDAASAGRAYEVAALEHHGEFARVA